MWKERWAPTASIWTSLASILFDWNVLLLTSKWSEQGVVRGNTIENPGYFLCMDLHMSFCTLTLTFLCSLRGWPLPHTPLTESFWLSYLYYPRKLNIYRLSLVVSDISDFFADVVKSYNLQSAFSIWISDDGKLSWLMRCLSRYALPTELFLLENSLSISQAISQVTEVWYILWTSVCESVVCYSYCLADE